MSGNNLVKAEFRFAIGENWLDYAAKIDEPRIAQAIADLQRLSGRERFDNLSFLDIGCGSGLHALAAIRMGAARVVGVDIDADSVAASRATFARFAPEANARFDVVSVFDMTPATHGGFDVVYSWGVLHHTGDMYRALTVAAGLVQPGGKFLVALYRRTPFCSMWRSIKRWYSRATPRNQAYARSIYIRLHRILLALRGRSLDDLIRDYGKRRGMDYYNDVHDWMGGYPYESISPEACRAFFASLGFGLEREFVMPLGRLPGLVGSVCDEFVFVGNHAE